MMRLDGFKLGCRIFYGGLAMASLALSPIPASAQLAPGMSGQSSAPVAGNEDDYWYLMRQMGDCLAGSKSEQSVAFLAAVPGSAEETDAFQGLFNRTLNACMKTFVRASFVRAHLRGAIAESLYRSRRRSLGSSYQPVLMEPEVIANLHDFARCYVSAHHEDAMRLLEESRLASSQEHELVASMAVDFGPCLPQGSEVVIRPIEIRLAIAEALYHTTLPAEEQN